LHKEQNRAHLYISGRVQGVFFRAATADEARRRGLSGWVRNRLDGRVEAVFQGEPSSVAAMVSWCHNGPPHARVDSVVADEGEPLEDLDEFDVKATV
jgi:acylphosphatase